jgi:hypothetical protein
MIFTLIAEENGSFTIQMSWDKTPDEPAGLVRGFPTREAAESFVQDFFIRMMMAFKPKKVM